MTLFLACHMAYLDWKMLILLILIVAIPNEVLGHGRLIEPPSRSSMWRYGFKTEPNYNDNELFCGGFTTQWHANEGKCGICGDPWNAPQPRENEAGGKYGKGIIVRNYSRGQVINATVQITANHKGYFEFKLCPTNDPTKIATQECLDRYPLQAQGTSQYKYILPDNESRDFNVHLMLPKDLECTHCVFQWTYTSGNTWGPCTNGISATGCGPQETFRGCADVRITGESNGTSGDTSTKTKTNGTADVSTLHENPTSGAPKNETNTKSNETKCSCTSPPAVEKPQGDSPNEISSSSENKQKVNSTVLKGKEEETNEYENCKAIGIWKRLPGMDKWCNLNCSMGYCPPTHCRC